jgi:uncharacterized protein (DUF1800 family)
MVRRMSAQQIAARLVSRTGFGARTSEVEAVLAEGLDGAPRRLLAARSAGLPAPPKLEPLPRPRKGDSDARLEWRRRLQEQARELTMWWLDRMVAAEHPWEEKRTLLWHGHWATSIQKVRQPALMLAQNQTLRGLGGGDFREMARAMVRDPALMLWLDANKNTAKAPNENLARELMELFTLGVGHYTENDIRQAARALSGWVVGRRRGDGAGRGRDRGRAAAGGKTPDTGDTGDAGDDDGAVDMTPRLIPRRHAPGTQTVLGKTADFTDHSLVDHLVSLPPSPAYLATRMWSWLVAPTPPGPAALRRMVTAYGSNRDMTAMFEAMLTDPAFTDDRSVLVKQPLEWAVGAMRALGLRPAKLPAAEQRRLVQALNGLGQVPFRPPSVGGWPSGEGWLSTSAAQTRLAMAGQLAQRADLSAVEDAKPGNDRIDAAARLLGVTGAGSGSGDGGGSGGGADAAGGAVGWTARTRAALASVQAGGPVRIVTAALCAPEYIVNR